MARPTGYDKLMRQLKAFPEMVRRQAAEDVKAGALDLKAAIRRACPDPKIAKSVDARPGANNQAKNAANVAFADARVGAGLSYLVFAGPGLQFPMAARWMEYGTKPHLIQPKNAKVLHFGGGNMPETFTGQPIHHPGERAQPYFMPTVRANKARIKNRIIRNARKAAQAAARIA